MRGGPAASCVPPQLAGNLRAKQGSPASQATRPSADNKAKRMGATSKQG